MKKYNVVIIGRPNVGKSSLFNRLVKKRQAIVHDVAGTTRDPISDDVESCERLFCITDTAGYFHEKNNELLEKSIQKVKDEISKADLLLLMVDGRISPTSQDEKIVELARKSGKPIFLVVNKVDKGKSEYEDAYTRFGFKNTLFVSVIHNKGISELLSEITNRSPKGKKENQRDLANIAIIGRPNVGKSSILNAIAKKELAIVSNIPGTTRDVVKESIKLEDKSYSFKDTAGARRPGKIGKAYKKGEPVEKYSNIRAIAEIEQADIVLLVIDSSEKLAAQDMHIAGLAKEKGKGIIIVVNKWDLSEEITQEKYLRRLTRSFNFMIWVPVVFVSAKTGRNIEQITKIVDMVSENQRREIPTSKLNRILEDFALGNLPKGSGTYKPKVFFAAQTGTIPPEFTISAKYHQMIHFSWRRAFENELRRHFDFSGTPIKIIFKDKSR